MVSSYQVIETVKLFWNDNCDVFTLDKILKDYLNNPQDYKHNEKAVLYDSIIGVVFDGNELKLYKLYYILSALLEITEELEVYYSLINLCTSDCHLEYKNKYFVYSQLSIYRFLHPEANNEKSKELLDALYEAIYKGYLDAVKDLCIKIPQQERNKELVFVITSQVLRMNHGPTKTLLDRCYVLQHELQKRVYIINTADTSPKYGEIIWFCAREGNYLSELSEKDYLDYKDEKFAFFQCPNQMPDISLIRDIMSVVTEEKPYYIISIGGENLTADLCAQIIPTLTVSLGPSERAETRTTFQMTGHNIDDNDRIWLRKHDYDENHIIVGLFTSQFKEQTHTLSRNDLELPNDKFICMVVGARLDSEVDQEFRQVIIELARNSIFTVFVGKFDLYPRFVGNEDLLKKNTGYIGFQKDILAVCECCNVYINPKRLGGGTSGAEALFKGVPVVTLNYGDVAIGVGSEFCVDNYDEMRERIVRLSVDREYYEKMRVKAHKRADQLMDSKGEFIRIIKEMESRKDFY